MCSRSFIVQKRGPKSVARYDLANSLGSGSFGAVLKATDRISNAPRAWKALKKGNSAHFLPLRKNWWSWRCFAKNCGIFLYQTCVVQVKWGILCRLATRGKENDAMFRREAVTMSVLDHPHICNLATNFSMIGKSVCNFRPTQLETCHRRSFVWCDWRQWAALFCYGALWRWWFAALPAGLQRTLCTRKLCCMPDAATALCHPLHAWAIAGTFRFCGKKCPFIGERFRCSTRAPDSEAGRNSSESMKICGWFVASFLNRLLPKIFHFVLRLGVGCENSRFEQSINL